MDQEGFEALSRELRAGENRQLTSIFEDHAKYCIIKLISEHRCLREDAEDIYTDAIINLREKIVSGNIGVIADLRAYIFGTCKNMLLRRIKKANRISEAVTESRLLELGDQGDGELSAEYKENLLAITREALAMISGQCEQLLKCFYFQRMSFEEIAKEMGFASSNVAKVSKARCFKKLLTLIKTLQDRGKKYEAVRR